LNQSFTFNFADSFGRTDIGIVNILINSALDGRQSCYLAYSRPLNTLYLVNDAGSGLLPGLTLNGSGSTSNSQCTVNGSLSSVSGTGSLDVLTLTLNISFAPTFGGNRIVYVAARNLTDTSNSGWQAAATWTVQ
jgi:outer membrane protein TolC